MAAQPNTTPRSKTSIPAMGTTIDLAAARPLDRRRNQAIMAAAMRYVDREGPRARASKTAIEEAIADMIGASQYLALRLGEAKARSVVSSLQVALGN
ncbi:hypothetical protein [Mesorhizobium sp. P5_C1]